MILIKNGEYLSINNGFLKGHILIKGGIIGGIIPKGKETLDLDGEGIEVIDAEGMKIIPGLVDIHTHGAMGIDVGKATPWEICKLARYYSDKGVTSFMPTIITDKRENIIRALRNIKKAASKKYVGATIEGTHIEGPFINPLNKGTHNERWISLPRNIDFDDYRKIMGDLKIHLTVAPEIKGGLDFIEYVVQKGGTIGLGHTRGEYEIILKAIGRGASIFTHLYNAMVPIHHRRPGTIGAALAGDTFVEIIPDGIHVHPAVVKATIKAKTSYQVVLVTDSMLATNYIPGDYEYGGSVIRVIDGAARQENGTIAGSTITLMEGIRNSMNFAGVPLEEAVIMASLNPAKVLGLDDKIGSIEVGKRADIVVLDKKIEAKIVFCHGVRVK